jgi:threonine dehydrogenase-like Zn-dependent dehydrogenase
LADNVSLAEGALTEPLSVALHGLRVVGVTASDKVAILGAGPIGLCTIVMLRYLGVTNIAIFDREDSRLERARMLGAELAVNVAREPLTEALGRFHGEGERFGARFVNTNVFVDAAGSGAALAEVMEVAPYRARIAVIALHKKSLEVNLFRMMANEITLAGSIAVDRAQEFGECVAMLAEGKQDLGPLTSHSFDFSNYHDALAIAGDAAQSAKVMLTFPGVA